MQSIKREIFCRRTCRPMLLFLLRPKIYKALTAGRKKNGAHHKYKKGYSDNGLSGYTVSSLKAGPHRYILFVFMMSLAFFRLKSGLSISWALICGLGFSTLAKCGIIFTVPNHTLSEHVMQFLEGIVPMKPALSIHWFSSSQCFRTQQNKLSWLS